MKDRDTPLRLVRKWEKMLPGVYSALDILRGEKDSKKLSWPDYCELPIEASLTFLVNAGGLSLRDAAKVSAELTACWTWRKTKKIFSFDPDLASSLAAQAEDTKDSDMLPADLLLHLPYPCIYIKAPGLLEYMDGFFAWIEFDLGAGRAELRIQWVSQDMEFSFPQVLHLLSDKTVKECIMDTVKTTMEYAELDIPLQEAGAKDMKIFLSAVQLILYLLSSNAEIEKVPAPLSQGKTKKNVTQLKIKDRASEVEEFSVGIRIGAALRTASNSHRSTSGSVGTGSAKRSHTRRGHWHHYWTGPKDGQRSLVLKWTAPTVIHPDRGEDNIVIYPVKN